MRTLIPLPQVVAPLPVIKLPGHDGLPGFLRLMHLPLTNQSLPKELTVQQASLASDSVTSSGPSSWMFPKPR